MQRTECCRTRSLLPTRPSLRSGPRGRTPAVSHTSQGSLADDCTCGDVVGDPRTPLWAPSLAPARTGGARSIVFGSGSRLQMSVDEAIPSKNAQIPEEGAAL